MQKSIETEESTLIKIFESVAGVQSEDDTPEEFFKTIKSDDEVEVCELT